jgi:uncharacterized membrane protein YbhN (UPF0104 family)
MNKTRLFLLFKFLVALIAMTLLFTRLDVKEIRSALQNPAYPAYIWISVTLLIPNLLLQWYRWHFLLCTIEPAVPVMESVGSLFGGVLMGFITPGRIGELGRSLFLKETDRWQAFGLAFIDKLYSLVVILIAGIWGVSLFLSYKFDYATFIVWPVFAIAFIITTAGIAVTLHPQWIRMMLYNLSLMLPRRDRMKRLIESLDNISKKRARTLLVFSALLYTIYILQFCLLANAFQPVPLMTALIATTSTFFTKTLLPISLADLGIREGASVFFFQHYGIAKVTAFNSSILLFSINVLIPTFFGFLFVLMSWRNTQHSHLS